MVERCGEDVAGRLHTARVAQRHRHDDVPDAAARVHARSCWKRRSTLRRVAARAGRPPSRDRVRRAYAYAARAADDRRALSARRSSSSSSATACGCRARIERTNRCPLGSCAITGTGFPIDRELTADLLGFDGPTGNTYGSIATVDYLLESVSAAAVLLVGLGRFVQDLLLWCTSEFNYLRLGDGFVQCSSIMPQKRNPVALEHARAIASKALGQAQAIVTAVHNTPFGDIVDTEDDLQPLVFAVFRRRDAGRCRLVAAAMATAEFDARVSKRAPARAGRR